MGLLPLDRETYISLTDKADGCRVIKDVRRNQSFSNTAGFAHAHRCCPHVGRTCYFVAPEVIREKAGPQSLTAYVGVAKRVFIFYKQKNTKLKKVKMLIGIEGQEIERHFLSEY